MIKRNIYTIVLISPIWQYKNNGTYTYVVRKAERQVSEKANELMINTFLNPAPRTPAVHGGLKRRNKRTGVL